MKTKVKRTREALVMRKDRLFVLRHTDGRMGVMQAGGIIAPMIFTEKPDADHYRQQILAHSSVPERIRRKQLKEWRVDQLSEKEAPEIALQTSLRSGEVFHTIVFLQLL